MDHERLNHKTIAAIILAILVGSLELVIIVGTVMAFIPKEQSAMMADVLPRDLNSIKPDWKMFIYHAVLAVALVAGWLAVTRFKQRLMREDVGKKIFLWTGISGAFLFLGCFAVNEVVRPEGKWAWFLLGAVVAGACATKLMWQEMSAWLWQSALLRKLFAVAIIIIPAIILGFTGPASAVGRYVLCVVVISASVAVIGVGIYSKPWRKIKIARVIRDGADLLVWLSANGRLAQFFSMAMPMVIVTVLAMTDPVAVLAKTAFGEHYYHFDFMLMASAYEASVGNVLGVDHNVFYGLGMPMMIGALAKFFFQQVDYIHVFQVYWWLCILYFVVFFVCLRCWLGSVLLAAGAIALTIKWQVFYSLSYPVSSIYPNGSVLRCLWDIPIFVLLFLHLTKNRAVFLWLAAVGIGGAIVYIPTTGVDLTVALATYLCGYWMLGQSSGARGRVSLAYILFVPAIVAFLGFYSICGKAVLHAGFWKDLSYYPHLFTNGFYNIWFWENLTQGKWLNFIMSVFVPTLYLGTLLWIGIRLWLREAKPVELLTMVICAYGLSLYHHYLTLSLQNNFYMRAVPLVWTIFYWVKCMMERIESPRRRALTAWGIAIACVFMLGSNRLYQAFPNMWNTQNVRNPMVDRRTAYGLPEDGRPYFFHQEAWNPEQEKLRVNNLGQTDERIFFEWQVPNHEYLRNLYAQEFDFKQDAALIASFTTPQEKVALLSSFEVHLLMQAKRRPLFFFFPVVASRGMYARTFPSTNLHTRTMMARTIDDLKKHQPRYVFCEAVILSTEVPKSYLRTHEALLSVMAYVKTHYHVVQRGVFLVAMERNDSE